MKILGLDPSMSNFGIVSAVLDVDTLNFEIEDMELVATVPSKNKKVRKNSDDLERARFIHSRLDKHLEGVSIVFVEVPHGSQSARAMASYGLCVGILGCIEVPIIQLTEREVKLGSVGNKTASKQDSINWATSMHPNAPWLKNSKGGILGKNEHLSDAVCAIHAGLRGDEMKNILSFTRRVVGIN